MYCKDCDFWKRTTDEDREIKRTGSCDCEKHVYGFAPEGGLGYWDLAGYFALILSGMAGEGRRLIMDANPDTWCTCENNGKCLGCAIEQLVRERLGTQGLAYLLAHVKGENK